jgi:glycosyltransferase involved in cell wall biosynthesis
VRILVISPTPTHPQDAGNRARIHAMLSWLKAAGHQVHLCLLLRENPSEAALRDMAGAWDELIAVPHDRTRERRSLGDQQALDDWILPEAEQAFASLAARDPGFGLVLVNYVFLSKAFTFFPHHVLKVLDTHDVFADRAAKLAAIGLRNAFFSTTAEEEARGLGRADIVLAIQSKDAAAFAARTRTRIITVGHIAAAPRPPLPPRPAGERIAIGYIGSINPINTRALRRFLDAFGPGTMAGAAEVIVAGGAGQVLAEGDGLRRLGPVADPDELYTLVDLLVNPHEGGTGLKIKTVEALQRGRPVIGTAAAFEGLPTTAAFHAAADAEAVAADARRYVADPAFRTAVAEASADLAARYAEASARAIAVLTAPAALGNRRDRPRLLLVTDVRFWRGKLGNHQRVASLIAALRGEAALDLFFTAPMSEAERAAALEAMGEDGRVFRMSTARTAAAPRGLTPYERTRFNGMIFASFEAHLAAHPPDGVVFEYIMLSYLRHARFLPPLTVLDTHDVMSTRAENFRRFGRIHFIRISTSEELRILDGFRLVLAIQPAEARWLDALLPGRVLLAPHAMPPVPKAGGGAGPRPRVGFIGGDSPMNRDGLLWLLDQVWPAVAPLGAELHVAGDVCGAIPPGREGVVAHGEVADGAAFLQGLDIAVNPVFYGGGLKIKTVEYLAHGLPSVLTAEAVFGITGGAGDAYVVAADRPGFIAALAALIGDPALRARMGESAQRFAARHFGPAALAPAARTLAQLARCAPRDIFAQPA